MVFETGIMIVQLIAHRGIPQQYPENSIKGLEAALQAGACFVETDVQLTSDGVPVLCHDQDLMRMTGSSVEIAAIDYHTVKNMEAGYPERFGGQYRHFRVASLTEFCNTLRQWPDRIAFIEIKRASLSIFGHDPVLEVILQTISPIITQCVLISFDHKVIENFRERTGRPIGWVLPEWSAVSLERLEVLAPEYAFCNRKRLPAESISPPRGIWKWVIYTVNDPAEVHDFTNRGFSMVETDTIDTMLSAPGLADYRCG